MQSIQAGTTATFAPDFVSADTLGDGFVVIQENPDGTDGPLVGEPGSAWNVQAVDSPNLTVTVPLSAIAGDTYRTASKHVANGALTGNMYNAKFLVTPAAGLAPPTNLTITVSYA